MIGAAHELMLPSHRCEYTFDTEGSDTTTWHTDLGVAAYDTVDCHDTAAIPAAVQDITHKARACGKYGAAR